MPPELPIDGMNKHTLHLAGATVLALSMAACGGDNDEAIPAVPTLAGFASLPADTYVDGPTSGQFITGGDLTNATTNYGYTLPFANKQPMQGFSALANAFAGSCWYVMQDNGCRPRTSPRATRWPASTATATSACATRTAS
jgi:hypothetical protein